MTKTWCVGGRHDSESKNQNVFEKQTLRLKKLVKLMKTERDFCNRNKSQYFTM